jgi:hypothetical protein
MNTQVTKQTDDPTLTTQTTTPDDNPDDNREGQPKFKIADDNKPQIKT